MAQKMTTRKRIATAGIIIIVIAAGAFMLFVAKLNSNSVSLDNPSGNSNIRTSTYKADNGWGYDIYVDDELLIHQPDIPALVGNRGFETEADARNVAELMVGKIRKNIFPPAVTIEELKEVGVVE